MSDAPSTQALPRQIDPRKFAQQGVHLSGELEVLSLVRLAAVLIEEVGGKKGVANADVVFGIDEQKVRTLTGLIDAEVNVTCQRCLEIVSIKLHCDVNLAMVWDEEDARQLPRSRDPWIVDEGLADLYDVLEEELLLALPAVAYHDTDCIDSSWLSCGESPKGGGDDERLVDANSNPFSVLKQLKDSPKS